MNDVRLHVVGCRIICVVGANLHSGKGSSRARGAQTYNLDTFQEKKLREIENVYVRVGGGRGATGAPAI